MAEAKGATLNQLAGLLFDRAATQWYVAIGLQVLSSALSTILVVAVPDQEAPFGPVVVLGLLLVAYFLRLFAENTHAAAQTMNRQAALSEGLGWPINSIQLTDWRRKAGKKLRARVKEQPRAPDYYAKTDLPTGPRRLAAMTVESAFYTRSLALTVRDAIALGLIFVGVALFVVLYVAATTPLPTQFIPVLAQFVPSVVLIVVGVDGIGWIIRLTQQAAAIKEVENDLDRILTSTGSEQDVLRLVTEYDCAIVNSIPIHAWIFNRKHDELRQLWDERAKDLGLAVEEPH